MRPRGVAGGSPGAPRPPRVLIRGLDEEGTRAAAAVVRLVGGEALVPGSPQVRDGGGVPPAADVDLVLAPGPGVVSGRRDTNAHAGAAAPVVVVGDGGILRLPGDEGLLADLVRAASLGRHAPVVPGRGTPAGVLPGVAAPGETVDPPRHLVVAVAGWQGGVGTTGLVRLLCGHAGAVAVDATGAGPGVVGPGEEGLPGVRWADLRAGEPSPHPDLLSRLPVLGCGPALVADPRGGADLSDPRLAPLLHHFRHSRDVVVDMGRWDGRAAVLTGSTARTLPGATPPSAATSLQGAGPGQGAAGRHGAGAGHRGEVPGVAGTGPGGRGCVDVVCLVGRGDDASVPALAGALATWSPSCPVVLVHTRRLPSALLGRALPREGRAGPVTTWHLDGRMRGPRARRRLGVLWSRLRRLAAAPSVGGGGS